METTLTADPFTDVAVDASTRQPPHLIRREPILDQSRGLAGYRIRVLWAEPQGPDMDTGSALIETARTHGAGAFFAYAPHWIDATPRLLRNARTLTLPHHRTYLEFPETLDVTPELIQNLHGMAQSGTKFSIRGDLAALPGHEPLLPFCKVVCFNPALSTKVDIFRQSFQHKQGGRQLMAVDTPDKATHDNFMLLGFNLFLGNWPTDATSMVPITARKKILLRLVTLIMGEGETPEIQACLQQDPELVKTLLDMVNTPAFGLRQEIRSLNQAIMLLGRRQLQRWIQVLMYTEAGQPAGHLSPTLLQASARAHLMEALSTLIHPEQSVRADAAFSTGMLSVMNQLFNGTMQDLLSHVRVDVPIREALLRKEGALGPDLRLAALIFPSSSDQAEDPIPLLRELGVTAGQLDPMIQQAFTWAHSITQAAP